MVSRVLMSTEVVGNLWPIALDLGRAYEDRGIEVVLVTVGRKLTNEQRRDAWAISSLTLYEQPLRSEWMDAPWDDVRRVGDRLLSLEQAYTPDVVHLHGYAQAALGFEAPVVLSCHNCVLSWWDFTRAEPLPSSFHMYRERVREGLHAAQAVVAGSSAMLRKLAQRYGSLTRSQVIPVGCDPEQFFPGQKEELVLTATRSWDGARNVALMEQVAAGLPWHCYAAVDDTRPPGVMERTERLHSQLQSIGLLPRRQLAEWLSRAAIYACPGSFDPTGLSVLEAALSGCALVLGETDMLRELWEGIAVFVDSADPEEHARAIAGLIQEKDTLRALAHAARERALPYSVQASAQAYLNLYAELIAERGVDPYALVRPQA